MRFRHVVTGAATAVVAGTVALAPSAQAVVDLAAPTVTSLPPGFGAIEVDPASQRVFVSSPASNVVTALSVGGAVLGSATVPGAGALVVDRGKLYVASTTGGRVDVFDAATLAPAGSYGGGTLVKPNTLAVAGGRVWTTTGTCGSTVRLVSIDTATGSVVTHGPVTSLSYCPSLHASPTEANVLVGFDTGLSPTTLVRLDVAGAAPAVQGTYRTNNSNGKDLEVMPDGASMALASGSPYEIRTFDTDPLGPDGVTYPTGHYPNAVEATAAGGGLLAAGRDATYDNDVDVFRLGDPSAHRFRYDFATTSNTVKDRGLAFSPDGDRLFVVSGSWSTNSTMLNVFNLVDPKTTTTVLEASPSLTVPGEPVTLTATVTPVAGGSPVTGTVTFTEGGVSLGAAAVDGSGRAVVTRTDLAVGLHTVTARYEGSPASLPSSAATSMRVKAADATNPVAMAPLPDGFSAVEVDPVSGRVFVSSPTSSTVSVLDEGGEPVGRLTVPGAGAMVVDGATLYVASTTGGRIDAFDIATLAPTGSFGGGTLELRSDTLVKAGGRLWTSTGVCGSSVGLASVDPVSGAVTRHAPVTWLSYCPSLFTSPTDPNLVLGFDRGISPSTLVLLDVSSGAPVVSSTLRTDNSNTRDGVVLPGGQTLALASGAPYEIRTFAVSPLSPSGVIYPTGAYPNAVEATSAAGGLIAAGRFSSTDGDVDVDVFRLGDPSTVVLHHEFGASGDDVLDGGLAFSPDGTRLFAVTGSWSGATRLNVLSLAGDPPPTTTTTTLAATPGSIRQGDPVTLTATVQATSGALVGGSVTFSAGGATLGTAPVGGSGTATLVVSSLAAGTHTITATYGGDGTLDPSSGTASVTVRAVTSLSLLTSANPSVWGQPLTLTANASATSIPSGTVTFLDGSAVLGTAPLDGNGVARLTTASLEVGGHSLRATYAGTAAFEPSASPVRAQTVQKAATTTALASSASTVPRDTPVTFTATVARSGSGLGVPTGSVTFRRGTTVLATVPLQSGQASLTAVLTPGSYTITASYSGDAHFTTSTSPGRTLVVSKGKR